MGLSASQARLLDLVARKNDLEFTGQQINQSRTVLANSTNNLIANQADLDPDSQESILLQRRIASIQSLDKALELQLRRVDTQQQAVSTEVEAVKRVLDKNIELVFKAFA
jgi:hypothetical protein